MLSGFSPHALGQLQGALGGGGSTTVVIDFSRLAEEIASLRRTASKIAVAVTNPTWAAGDELFRRCAIALESEWYEDALRDANGSIEAYPYRAAPHLFKAVALLHLGDTVDAYRALESAVKYGRAADLEHAATAGLLAANIATGAGNIAASQTILIAANDATGGRCPHLITAVADKESRTVSETDHRISLLCDDPGAWLTVDTRDDFFGPKAAKIDSAYEDLLGQLQACVAASEEFYNRASSYDWGEADFFRGLYDFGNSRATVAVLMASSSIWGGRHSVCSDRMLSRWQLRAR